MSDFGTSLVFFLKGILFCCAFVLRKFFLFCRILPSRLTGSERGLFILLKRALHSVYGSIISERIHDSGSYFVVQLVPSVILIDDADIDKHVSQIKNKYHGEETRLLMVSFGLEILRCLVGVRMARC